MLRPRPHSRGRGSFVSGAALIGTRKERIMSRVSFAAATTASLLLLVGFGTSASAGIFADSPAVSYASGTLPAQYATYNNPSTATGALTADTNVGQVFGFGPLTPFNATWQDTQMVGIGPGGHLTLELGRTASQIGVHSGVGLIDANFPNGQNLNPAIAYTEPRLAQVSVSANGTTYFSLGTITFDIPSNYYATGVTSPFQTTPGTTPANFEQAFGGTLASFNGQSWAGTLAVLGGSAGGAWLDVTGVLPGGANYVRFDVGASQIMFVDAVATVAAAVPEPGAAVLVLLSSLTLLRRR
jgi:hypothetical protein